MDSVLDANKRIVQMALVALDFVDQKAPDVAGAYVPSRI